LMAVAIAGQHGTTLLAATQGSRYPPVEPMEVWSRATARASTAAAARTAPTAASTAPSQMPAVIHPSTRTNRQLTATASMALVATVPGPRQAMPLAETGMSTCSWTPRFAPMRAATSYRPVALPVKSVVQEEPALAEAAAIGSTVVPAVVSPPAALAPRPQASARAALVCRMLEPVAVSGIPAAPAAPAPQGT
jgi:hypothetical protein